MTELLAPVLSIVRTGERMDRFCASLPAFKAAHLAKAEIGFIVEALDCASGADSAVLFDVHMNTALAAVLRAKRHLAALEAEIARAGPTNKPQTALGLMVGVER